jgi:hypothetical protein
MTIILSAILIIGPAAIVYCAVKALQHTLIIRDAKKTNTIPTALIASMWEVNGPDRKYGI